MSYSQKFGQFAANAQYASLPANVVSGAKLRILDVIAAACAGIELGKERELLRMLDTSGSVSIWGSNTSRSMRDAVIINTASAHACYFEDGSRYTGGHPASAVIPAMFALAQGRQISGQAFLTSIAVGYEIFLRLGRAIYPSTVRRGFQSTSILAAPSCAAAASSLLGLTAQQSSNAISIGCSHGAGLKEALKSADSQPFQVGRSAEGGVLSALYAQLGVHGAPQIFEQGFLKAFAEDPQLQGLDSDLGSRWSLEETYLKIHGGCRGNHAPVDATALLIQHNDFSINDIEFIEAFVDSVTYAAAIEPPLSGEDAQFSIGFSIAVRLLKGDALPARYSMTTLVEREVVSLIGRIRVMPSVDLDVGYPARRPTVIKIQLRDGRRLVQQLDHAKGEPENPTSIDDIRKKYRTLACPVFGSVAEQIEEMVFSLDQHTNIDILAQLLRVSVANERVST
jgi:2-methylcitrate dehydratase PrpD